VRDGNLSTACEIALSKRASNDEKNQPQEKASLHTFTLDQTAAISRQQKRKTAKGKIIAVGEAGQHIVATQEAVAIMEELDLSQAPNSSTTLGSAEVVVGEEVFVLFVAYTEKEITLPGVEDGRGVWAMVLKRSLRETELYQQVGLIWPPLGYYPAHFSRLLESESCIIFLEGDVWLNNADLQEIVLV
jgi:hypothetical protein